MSRPDWKDAPEWAQWLAMDKNGHWYWHEYEPVQKGHEWDSGLGSVMFAEEVPPIWGTTLEPRP